jgi:hypothetical protein
MSIFEIIMLVCFGAAWPFALMKSWRSRQNGGKSLGFLAIVLTGYLSGIVHKLLHSRDPVIFLYALNAVMVATDIALYVRNGRLMRRAAG